MTCPDPFHEGARGIEYVVPTPGPATMTGFQCPTCGFQTVTWETYVPLVKPCPECGRTFEGMADVPTEICDQCFADHLNIRLAEAIAEDKQR